MKNVFIVSLFFLFLLSGCVTSPNNRDGVIVKQEFKSIEDPFFAETMNIRLSYADSLVLTKYSSENRRTVSLEIVFKGNDWRFMDGDLTIKADNSILKYKCKEPDRDVLNGGVSERLVFWIPKTELQEIANAQILLIQYYGGPEELSELQRSYIKKFYNELCNDLTY